MKLTKIFNIALLLTATMLIQPLFSQYSEGNFDIIFSTGYGIPIGGYTDNNLQSRTYNSLDEIIEEKDHYLNYGKGIQLNGGINYFLMNDLAMQVLVHYTAGVAPIRAEHDYESPLQDNTDTYKRNLLSFTVMAVPHFEMFRLLDMYCGVGIGLSFAFLKIENDNDSFPYEGNFKTKPGLTFSGLLGADFPLNDVIALFGEVAFDQMSFTIKSSKTTDDPDQIDYERDSNSSPTPFKIPGSNLGLRIGIRFAIIK